MHVKNRMPLLAPLDGRGPERSRRSDSTTRQEFQIAPCASETSSLYSKNHRACNAQLSLSHFIFSYRCISCLAQGMRRRHAASGSHALPGRCPTAAPTHPDIPLLPSLINRTAIPRAPWRRATVRWKGSRNPQRMTSTRRPNWRQTAGTAQPRACDEHPQPDVRPCSRHPPGSTQQTTGPQGNHVRPEGKEPSRKGAP